MDVRDKVRERRQERIKQIREREWRPPADSRYPSNGGGPARAGGGGPSYGPRLSMPGSPPGRGYEGASGRETGPSRPVSAAGPQGVRPPAADSRLEDPEYVWKHRESLRSAYGSAEGWSRRAGEFERQSGGPGDFLPSGGGSGLLRPPSKSVIGRNLAISVLIFAAVWGLFRLPYPWAQQGRDYVTRAMTQDLNFAAVQAWYASVFSGAPSFLPVFHGKTEQEARKASSAVNTHYLPPVSGRIVVPYSSTHTGVTIETQPREQIRAVDEGRVMTVNATSGNGMVVMIQHSQGMQSIYGGVADTTLKKNDWVQRGDRIGMTAGSAGQSKAALYFSVKKEDQYVNPADVIPFD